MGHNGFVYSLDDSQRPEEIKALYGSTLLRHFGGNGKYYAHHLVLKGHPSRTKEGFIENFLRRHLTPDSILVLCRHYEIYEIILEDLEEELNLELLFYGHGSHGPYRGHYNRADREVRWITAVVRDYLRAVKEREEKVYLSQYIEADEDIGGLLHLPESRIIRP